MLLKGTHLASIDCAEDTLETNTSDEDIINDGYDYDAALEDMATDRGHLPNQAKHHGNRRNASRVTFA